MPPLTLNTCPRKAIRPANAYFSVYNWSKKGLLEYQYPPDALPAKYAEAIEVIDMELDEKQQVLMDAQKKSKE